MTDTKTTSSEIYRKQGMGQRIGFGQRPAVLIIDMQHDFCDPEAPTTLWPSIGETYAPIRQLCASARARRVPVFYTQGLVAGDGSSAGLWRYKQRYHAEGRVQIDGSKGAAIIPEVAPEPGDRIIRIEDGHIASTENVNGHISACAVPVALQDSIATRFI